MRALTRIVKRASHKSTSAETSGCGKWVPASANMMLFTTMRSSWNEAVSKYEFTALHMQKEDKHVNYMDLHYLLRTDVTYNNQEEAGKDCDLSYYIPLDGVKPLRLWPFTYGSFATQTKMV